MPYFSSQSLSVGSTASALSIVIVAASVFAVGYVDWSSSVNLSQFMSRTATADYSAPNPLPKGRTGCPQGNKPLPALSLPVE
ncbi:hypothetical protein [Bradyrhizobium viridifuturi]|uniref:hypothetical protein n=1 Tax=Bradyrhizobium viridifuturi TaxID=1654716 RepID=UPI000FE144A8|nr:hypothetical protein [Bradyrhizobium viridifuturi]